METILFMGDSITDGNRYKLESERWDLNHQMGHSYAYVINALLGSRYPERNFKFLNRGISGNRVLDMYGRMYEDMVELKPDIVSILAGVNDGPLDIHAGRPTGAQKYGRIYRMMLEELKQELPKVKLVICEPFVVKAGARRADYEIWRSCIDGYRIEARKTAEEFDAVFVPLQELFDEVCAAKEAEYWVWDGIHPTENGHGLIAKRWLDCVGEMLGVQ